MRGGTLARLELDGRARRRRLRGGGPLRTSGGRDPPRAGSPSEPAGSPATACVPDDCSLATLRAMITPQLKTALAGRERATEPAVRAVAERIARDLREDQTNLDALEAQLAISERSCAESRRAATYLKALSPAPEGPLDRTLVTAQIAAFEEMKRIVNDDLIGCAANGSLKTTLRFARARSAGGGGDGSAGFVADLAALEDLAGAGARGAGSPSGGSRRTFVHPGILVTRAQLDFVRRGIALDAEPWTSAFARAAADRHGALDYAPHPPRRRAATDTTPAADDGLVLCGSFSDPDVHCSDEKEDAVAAYTQALLWYLGGDDRHARNAVAILDAWAMLEDHRLFNAALEAAWTGSMFARAAELMQLSPLWATANVTRFKTMTRRAFLPRLLAARPGWAPIGDASYGQNGNWVLSIADALIQLGVLLDDGDAYDQGVALWRDRVPSYCYRASLDGDRPRAPLGGYGGSNAGYATPATRTGDPLGYWGQAGGATPAAPGTRRASIDGMSQETCRDLEHVQFGLAAMMNGAETARIQGTDLYREQAERMAACMELAALYESQAPMDAAGRVLAYATPIAAAIGTPAREPNLCPDVTGRPTVVLLNAGSLAAYAVQPTWEVGYNALANRAGLALPLTRQLIARYRTPPTGWAGATHHMGWETLTHGDVGSVGLPPVSPARDALGAPR
jgi:hypothetical protein